MTPLTARYVLLATLVGAIILVLVLDGIFAIMYGKQVTISCSLKSIVDANPIIGVIIGLAIGIVIGHVWGCCK